MRKCAGEKLSIWEGRYDAGKLGSLASAQLGSWEVGESRSWEVVKLPVKLS